MKFALVTLKTADLRSVGDGDILAVRQAQGSQ